MSFGNFAAPNCSECPFAVNGQPPHKPVLGEVPACSWENGARGEVPKPLGTVVGESPTQADVEAGRPLASYTGEQLDNLMAEQGIRRTQFFTINAIACKPADGRTAVELRQAAKACRPLFKQQLKAAYGDKFWKRAPTITMGKLAALQWYKLFKNRGKAPSLQKGRGFVRHGHLIATWHPVYAFLHDPWELGAFTVDVARFGRMIRGEMVLLNDNALFVQPPLPALKKLIADIYRRGECSFDIETGPQTRDEPWTGKQPGYARLRTIGLGTPDWGLSVVPEQTHPQGLKLIRKVLADEKIVKVGMNSWSFDIPILQRYGYEVK